MRYSISTCSFYKYRIRKLLPLEAGIGVEIFYEFGSEDMWIALMNKLNQSERRPFSIHAPFAFVDIAARGDKGKLFDILRQPFNLYHKFNGEFYVLHTYGDYLSHKTAQQRDYARKLATERLEEFSRICKANEVVLGAENLCSGATPLFDQEQFLKLFKDVPDMNCVIDVGHAIISGMDIAVLQETLNSRICAYHLHNNDGKEDQHRRLKEGVFDWMCFAKNCSLYTPNATGVLEYMDVTNLDDYRADVAFLENLVCKSSEHPL